MKKRLCALLGAALLLLTGCSAGMQEATGTLFAMDTTMTLTVYGQNAKEALSWAQQEINRYDRLFAVQKEDSDPQRINAGAGRWISVSQDTVYQLQVAEEVAKDTGGALDLSIYPLSRAWGFGEKEYRVPDEAERKEALSHVDYNRIQIKEDAVQVEDGMELDLGSIAKGYVSEKLAEGLKEQGISSAILSLGGNMQMVGQNPEGRPWRIGIQDPKNPEGLAGILDIGESAVITSGSYQRFFEAEGKTYHHILDPKTGAPAQSGLVSVTIVHEKGTYADALSTALFVLGLEEGLRVYEQRGDFEAVFVTDSGRVVVTPGLKEEFAPVENSGYSFEFVE